ncbi:hypothetical protein GCM10027068_49160 [Prescottella soli]
MRCRRVKGPFNSLGIGSSLQLWARPGYANEWHVSGPAALQRASGVRPNRLSECRVGALFSLRSRIRLWWNGSRVAPSRRFS